MSKEYTPAQFAAKFRIGRRTVYRWLSSDVKRFKMYDAKVVVVEGRKLLRIER